MPALSPQMPHFSKVIVSSFQTAIKKNSIATHISIALQIFMKVAEYR